MPIAFNRHPALVAYITCGDPDIATTREIIRAAIRGGADVIELGVPFSDPHADGPVIQRASERALKHHTSLQDVLAIAAEIRRAPDPRSQAVGIIIFSYLNPLMAAGPTVLERAAAAGISGVLVTDLPVGADPDREQWLADGPLAFIRLAAPTTPTERMAEIASHGSGFVYLISRLGVTGTRDTLPEDLPRTVQRLRSATTLPICVGFGISTPDQARAVGALADGVVVGSALVRAAGESVHAATVLARELRAALDAP